MKKVLFFCLKTCPYCIKAFRYLDELKAENPAYADIDIEIIEESKERERAEQYDYWFVPALYVDEKKLHEGVLEKEKLKSVLDAALED